MSVEDRGGHSAAWGVTAVVLGGIAVTAWLLTVTVPGFPAWPTGVFGCATGIALYLVFATICAWPPYAPPVEKSPTGVADSPEADRALDRVDTERATPRQVVAESAAGALALVIAAPVAVGFAPESDTGTDTEPVEPVRGTESAPKPEPVPAVTNRWHHTSDGFKVPGLMNLTHTTMSHPGYQGRQTEDERPSIKIGMLVGCEKIDPSSSGSALRAKFLAFLDSARVRELVRSLTFVPPEASWRSLAGNGVRTLEAALMIGDDPTKSVPFASALFLPPTGEAMYGRPEGTATLVLYVEPQTVLQGEVPPGSDLRKWHQRIRKALTVPGAFANFLSDDLGLGLFGAPPVQFGIWLESHNKPLSTMIDTDGLRTLPGAWSANEFMGWAYADRDGKSDTDVARDIMVHLCEYRLHLDDFESHLP